MVYSIVYLLGERGGIQVRHCTDGGYDALVQFLSTIGSHSDLVEYTYFGWYFLRHVCSKHVEYYPPLVDINELS